MFQFHVSLPFLSFLLKSRLFVQKLATLYTKQLSRPKTVTCTSTSSDQAASMQCPRRFRSPEFSSLPLRPRHLRPGERYRPSMGLGPDVKAIWTCSRCSYLSVISQTESLNDVSVCLVSSGQAWTSRFISTLEVHHSMGQAASLYSW